MSNTRIITCALAIAGVLFVGGQAPAADKEVTVTNTPLPVTVTNPTVPPSTVNVGNPAALAAANAQAIGVGTPAAFSVGTSSTAFSVPVGKRFVIEYVSGACTGPSEGFTGIFVSTNGVFNHHYFAVGSNSSVSFSHLVKIYADPGSTVSQELAGNCIFTLSGQLVTP